MAGAKRLFPHGGARNRADRTSDCLTEKQARKLIAAIQRAEKLSMPINRHIIVHWEALGVPDDRAMAATTQFLKAYREWTGDQTAYVWSRENGDGKGSHLHILAHLPAGKRWHAALSRRWLERISGNRYKKRAIRTKFIMGSLSPDSPCYDQNLKTVAAYVLKGVDRETAAALGIAHLPGGRITGKRCGTSRNIG